MGKIERIQVPPEDGEPLARLVRDRNTPRKVVWAVRRRGDWPRHRHREFLRFLKTIDERTQPNLDLHLIVDNYATHKTPAVKRWLKQHSRFHLHFTPTSGSWLNVVERFFAEITRKRIRRGVFNSVVLEPLGGIVAIEDPSVFTRPWKIAIRSIVAWNRTSSDAFRQLRAESGTAALLSRMLARHSAMITTTLILIVAPSSNLSTTYMFSYRLTPHSQN
jgi:DDE superfamily endonuclease